MSLSLPPIVGAEGTLLKIRSPQTPLLIAEACKSLPRPQDDRGRRFQRRVVGVPEALPLAGPLFKDQDLFRRTRQRGRRQRRRGAAAVEVANAAAGELARRRVQLAHTRRVIAGPAQAPRAVDVRLMAVSAQHRVVSVKTPGADALRLAKSQAAAASSLRAASGAPGTNRSARTRLTSANRSRRISSRGVSSYQLRK